MMSFQLMGLCKQPRWPQKAGKEDLLVYSPDPKSQPDSEGLRNGGKRATFFCLHFPVWGPLSLMHPVGGNALGESPPALGEHWETCKIL